MFAPAAIFQPCTCPTKTIKEINPSTPISSTSLPLSPNNKHSTIINSFKTNLTSKEKQFYLSINQPTTKNPKAENMSGNIPTATFVSESAVIEAPLAQVWHLIKLQDFSTFWSKLSTSEVVKDASPEADVVRWTFADKTVLDVKQEEHSSIDHYITYSIISAEPALSYTSVVSTIRCYPITSGKHANHTYVTWTGNFSSDAGADVVQDGRYKRQEALADLAKKVSTS